MPALGIIPVRPYDFRATEDWVRYLGIWEYHVPQPIKVFINSRAKSFNKASEKIQSFERFQSLSL